MLQWTAAISRADRMRTWSRDFCLRPLTIAASNNGRDNAAAYVYLTANEGYWDRGSALFLARVPRAKLKALRRSDYQFYIGGNGVMDSSWTSAQSRAVPVISARHKLGEPSVQLISALNRYLLLTFSYPEGLAIANRHSEHTL